MGIIFIKSCLGPNAKRMHKYFERFFGVRNPLKPMSPKSTPPNQKLEPYSEWMKCVSVSAQKGGRNISADEQTRGFQRCYGGKLQITYECGEQGFQWDALCDNGYTFTFFRHHSPPKKYKAKGLLPLHSCVVNLSDGLEDLYQECSIDNLQMSAKFLGVH